MPNTLKSTETELRIPLDIFYSSLLKFLIFYCYFIFIFSSSIFGSGVKFKRNNILLPQNETNKFVNMGRIDFGCGFIYTPINSAFPFFFSFI